MTARNIVMVMLLAIILLLLWMHSDVRAISKRLEAIENDLQWCIWEHDNHNTKLIKGGKSAEKFRRDIGRPSDDGRC